MMIKEATILHLKEKQLNQARGNHSVVLVYGETWAIWG